MARVTSGEVRAAALRYGLAVNLVIASFAISNALRDDGDRPFLIFIFAAVLMSSWWGGAGPGWLAVFLSTILIDYFYIPPVGQVTGDLKDVPWLIAFIVCAVFGNIASSRQRRVNEALHVAHDHLETRVAERTSELEQANNELQAEITERNRTEQALREAQLELERVMRATAMG